ncbi:MAG: discoidin domain-containing protein [Elusimicrobia bacterium]|nr:discoidin domain-containing protein [Elusimicrobiota bacterium]
MSLRAGATALTSGAAAGAAVDGSATTGWVSAAADSQWWQADLGEARWMNRMALKWGASHGVEYKLKASMDGRRWKTLYQTTAGDGGTDEVTFGSVRARYVRWEGTRRSGSGGYELKELEVYGPDIRAWASTEGASLPAAHAVDGDERTRWAGQAIDPQWLAVDFGETRAFDTVRLVWEVAYGKDYLVQVSTDKANWVIVGAVTGGDGGVDEVAVGAQQARYLRIYGLVRGTAWGYSLYELDAYGPADPVEETLVGSYGEGTASGEIIGLTNVGAIVAAIQSHRNQILKDGNGNMVIARDKWIAYDYENRPVKVVMAEGNVTEYAYDAEGQRVKATGAGGTTYFVGTVYEDRGTERIKYVHAGGQRVAQVSSAAGTSYFHVDQLGSVSALTNGAGAVTRTLAYTPFGGSFEAGGSGETAWRFTGQRQDDGTGLYYYNARYYDPALGRFITPDVYIQSPYDPQTHNRYTYCRNNPVNLVDPDGHFFWIPVLVGAAMAGTHGRIFSGNAWQHFDFKAAVIGAAAGAAGQWGYTLGGGGAGGAFLGGMMGGATQGALGTNGNVFQGAVLGSVSGGMSGLVSYGVGQLPIFDISGSPYISGVHNPIANGVGAFLSAYLLGGKKSEAMGAWRSGYWSGILNNLGQYTYSAIKEPPTSGEYLMSRRLGGTDSRLKGTVGIGLQLMGIGHYAAVDFGTGRTKELFPENGEGIAREYNRTERLNSLRNYGGRFGTSYRPLTVSFDQIPTGSAGRYLFIGNNSNHWANSVIK